MSLTMGDARDLATAATRQLRERGRDAYHTLSDAADRAAHAELWEHLAEAALAAARSAQVAARDAKPTSGIRLATAAGLGFLAGVVLLGGRKAAMQASTAIAGDWFAQLRAEHKQVDALFELACATKDNESMKRMALLNKLSYALNKHALQEENVIYPALRDTDQGASSKALAAEHFDMKTYLHELYETPAEDPRWLSKMKAFRKLVASHVRDEEEHIYPAFHAKLSHDGNAKLTRAMNREGIKLA